MWLPFYPSFHLHPLLPWFPREPNHRSLCPSPWGPAGTPLLPLTRPLTLLTLGSAAENRWVCVLVMCVPGLQHWHRWAPARQPGFSRPQHKPEQRTVGIFNTLSCLWRCYYTPSPYPVMRTFREWNRNNDFSLLYQSQDQNLIKVKNIYNTKVFQFLLSAQFFF